MPQGPQVDMFEHVERLQQNGSLRPGRLGVNRIAREVGLDGGFDTRLVGGQVVVPQQTIAAFGKGGDAVGDVALVKHRTGRLQAVAARSGGLPFGLRQ